MGSIRDVMLDNSQNFYLSIFSRADKAYWNKQAQSQFLSTFPRFAFEALGLILISIIAASLFIQKGGGSSLISTLGVLALGAQRLLPAMQQFIPDGQELNFNLQW